MNSLRVEALMIGQVEQCFQYVTADFGGAWFARHTEMIAATGNFHIQAVFD